MEIKNLENNLGRYLTCGDVQFFHNTVTNKFFFSVTSLNCAVCATLDVEVEPTDLKHSLFERDDNFAITLSARNTSLYFSFDSVEAYCLACDVFRIEPHGDLCEAFKRIEQSFQMCNPADEDR
ncbi:hypothetical protein [Vibrio fluvialis]|uniref:hypothetical protein n=1 Tax=Vibrio fluvialis TaxID=676 RepID=UPI001F1D0158|nr:hypothetical protein [Vibrio fluvialis]MCE7644168.1 hypothetical protein [Vibrio fluvialis]